MDKPAMHSNTFQDDCERYITINKGAIEYESVLFKRITLEHRMLGRLFVIIEDHIQDDEGGEYIDWPDVWKEWGKS